MADGKPRYRVERAAPETVRDDLARIWSANLALEADAAVKHRWLYGDAPEVSPQVFLLVAEGGDPAGRVGTAGVLRRRIRVGDRELRAGLLGDLAVDRAHRSVMPAITLVREVRAWALAELDLAYGFPNRAAEGVFKRVGYAALGTMTRYVRVLRHAAYVDRVGDAELARVPARLRPVARAALTRPGTARWVARGADLAMLARGGLRLARAARELEVEWFAGRTTPELDALWANARHEHGVVGVRDREHVDWRFFRAAGGDRRALVVARARGGAARAYAVVEDRDGVAVVRDLFGHRAETLALVDRLIPRLYRRGATSISFRYLGAPWLVDGLAERGFVARQSDRMVALGVGQALAAPLAARLADPAGWYLTDFDEDV